MTEITNSIKNMFKERDAAMLDYHENYTKQKKKDMKLRERTKLYMKSIPLYKRILLFFVLLKGFIMRRFRK
jgi:uncharacterized protein YecA (UPF0149 family)